MNLNKRISLVLLLFLFFLTSLGCASNPTAGFQDNDSTIGILWEVKKPDSKPSFLFGTIHSEDERVTQLPKPVSKAFNSAKTFALEMILDKKTTREVLKKMYFSDGRTLQQAVGNDLFKRSVDAMEKKGLPANIVGLMKPWAVFTILNMPEQKTGLFLDAILFEKAKEQKKKIIGLETQEEQTAVFDEMALSSQKELLKNTLDNLADMNKLLDQVIDIYLTRDLEKVMALNNKYEKLIDEEVAKEFSKRLVTNRNQRMVDRMLPLLIDGDSFIAVGALHLPGDDGIIKLLQKKGYEVSSVY